MLDFLTGDQARNAAHELIIQAPLTLVFLFIFRNKIGRWVQRLNEATHSRMLDVVDFTQTIVEDGVLKVRTVMPTTIDKFTLHSEELTKTFGEAVQNSYHNHHEYVVLPAEQESHFKKLATIIYSHANTAFNQEASWERFKPPACQLKTVTIQGRLVVYAEKDAEVSKVHVEFVPDSLWNELREGDWDVRPERDNEKLLIRLRTLWEIKQACERFGPGGEPGHLMVFRFDAEMIDYRGTIAEMLAEAS